MSRYSNREHEPFQDWPYPGSDIHAVSGSTYPKPRKSVWPWIVGLAVMLGFCVVTMLLAQMIGPPGDARLIVPTPIPGQHTTLPDPGTRPEVNPS